MTFRFKAVLAAAFIAAVPAQAATYDLSGDFSNSANPNGAWTYGAGLSHYPQPSTPNGFNGAAADGYWGAAGDFFAPPFVVRVTANGAGTGSYTNEDFLAGDVVVHGPNDSSPVVLSWTAPDAGTFDLTSSFWYAHSVVTRAQDIAVALDGTVLGSFTVTNGIGRSSALTLSLTGLGVDAGDVLSFSFAKSPGQTFGSLSGIAATIDFTPRVVTPPAVPEPASWAMMIGGFALAGAGLRRRKAAAPIRFA